MVVAYLDIISWAYSVGGEHYTGEIKASTKSGDMIVHRVSHSITAKEALHLNKKDCTPLWGRYTPGDTSTRYDSKDQLVRDASEIFLSKHQGILINGFYGCASPRPVICASKGLEKQFRLLNKLAIQWEKLGNYDTGNDIKTKRLNDWWSRIIWKIKYEESLTT